MGFAGLVGAGRTEVARAIFGADSINSGEILRQRDKRYTLKARVMLYSHGIGYLSEDRKRYGLTLGMDVQDNMVLASLKKFLNRIGWVDFKEIVSRGQEMVRGVEHQNTRYAAEG